MRCWFQKQRQDSHSWYQKTLKSTWRSFLFGNRSVPSFSTEKNSWSQCFCAFLAAVNVSQHGTSHGQEDFPDVHFFFSSYPVNSSQHPVPHSTLSESFVQFHPESSSSSGWCLLSCLQRNCWFCLPALSFSTKISLHKSLVYTDCIQTVGGPLCLRK